MDDLAMPVEAEFTLLRKQIAAFKRRGDRRYRCPIAMMGKVVVEETGAEMTALVLDLSASGIGLQLTRSLADGARMNLRLTSADNRQVYYVPAIVAHATRLAEDSWRVGCVFAEKLGADTIDDLL
jgi:hypothetical protein